MKRMTMEQKKLLNNRISDLYGWLVRDKAADKVMLKDTPEVKKARALVAKFDAANKERRNVVEQRYIEAHTLAREATCFKDPQDAYAYVMALKPLGDAK